MATSKETKTETPTPPVPAGGVEAQQAQAESAMRLPTAPPAATPEEQAAREGLMPFQPAQDPAEQNVTDEYLAERARQIVASVDPHVDRPNAEKLLAESAPKASGGRWRVAHTQVGQFSENQIVSSQELGEGIERLIQLGAVVPLDSDAQAQSSRVNAGQVALDAYTAAANETPGA